MIDYNVLFIFLSRVEKLSVTKNSDQCEAWAFGFCTEVDLTTETLSVFNRSIQHSNRIHLTENKKAAEQTTTDPNMEISMWGYRVAPNLNRALN